MKPEFMSTVLPQLPDERLQALAQSYSETSAAKRSRTILFVVILAGLTVLSALVAEVDLGKLFGNLGNFFSYFDRILTFDSGPATGQRVWTDPAEWFWGLDKWLVLLAETILVAYLGTMLGGIAAFLLCFFAAANLMPRRIVRTFVKRFLEFCRTVPEIVFALIFVIAFGLGAVPGVLAITIHTAGALGKLFSEVVENIDMKPVEGVTSTGADWVQAIRFAVVPQVLSNFASYALLRFEINMRGASVMGFVGAGGIGQDLIEAIRKFYYADVSAILLLIILTVMLIDLATERLRHTLLGLEGKR
jgi:phosphonate transport system permease protein